MRYATLLLFSFFILPENGTAQAKDSSKQLWAFPITDYTVSLNDTAMVVQIQIPAALRLIQQTQVGVLRGVYKDQNKDTAIKGWGKCHLIKSDYNYFSINLVNGAKPKAGDLIYTLIPVKKHMRNNVLPAVAAQAIIFLDVDGNPFYSAETFFHQRTSIEDDTLMSRMATDIKRVGEYYLTADVKLNQPIDKGQYKGRRMLEVMIGCTKTDLIQFLRYVAARPRLYAGNNWKISETFATWLVAGAPMVKEE